jgi:hypothetical protein
MANMRLVKLKNRPTLGQLLQDSLAESQAEKADAEEEQDK